MVIEDWTFAHLKREETLWGPHGYHRYPAKFIPQLVHRIIDAYSSPNELVGDPFLGRTLANGLPVIPPLPFRRGEGRGEGSL